MFPLPSPEVKHRIYIFQTPLDFSENQDKKQVSKEGNQWAL